MKKRLVLLLFILFGLIPLFTSCSDSSVPSTSDNNVDTESDRKVVYDIYYEIESRDVNNIEYSINLKVREFGGYIANSVDNKKESRYTYKVPTSKLNEFLDYVDHTFDEKVTDKTIKSTDITTKYSKVLARIEVLEASKLAYLNMLKNDNLSMSQIFDINNEIENIDTELVSLYNTLASYDSVIDYTQITIEYVDDPRFFASYGDYLADSFKVIYKIFFYALPYGLAVGLVVFLANLPGILRKRKREKEKLNKE